MSTRPSSNTANRPTGPAPTMTASVLITCSAMTGSKLLLGDTHHQAVQRLCHLDLAREPARRPHIEGKVEHVLLHLRRTAGGFTPRVIDIDVASGASAGAAAFGGNARDVVLHRGFHHRHAGLRLDNPFGPVVLDKGDSGHDIGALGIFRSREPGV